MKQRHTILLATILICACITACLYGAEEPPQGIRVPAVSGMFYPRDSEQLSEMVRTFLKEARGKEVPGRIRGIVAPHAGYIYSGIVAAAVYRQIEPSFRKIILLGPSHRVPLKAASILDCRAYSTPLGDVRLAPVAATFRAMPGFESVTQAHLKEHALEVQLPFLQVILEEFEIVPILTNSSDPERLASVLAPYIGEDTLVVASSDLSHYYSYDTANSLDRICTSAIPDCKFSGMPLCEACGKQAVLTLMHIARIKGWQGYLVDYKNSGDTAGSKDRVVGYASIAFVNGKEMTKTMSESISTQDRKALLRLARSVIEARLVEGTQVDRPSGGSPVLNEQRGCFVTLHKQGQLRGCIGTIEPVCTLVECVERNAENAAFRDPRFRPLNGDELKEIDVEISVLSVPKVVSFTDGEDLKGKLVPKVDGVILSRGMHRSTFLPQVWEQLPDKEQFLERLCLKGGMPPQAWQDPATEVSVYQAEVFGEKDFE